MNITVPTFKLNEHLVTEISFFMYKEPGEGKDFHCHISCDQYENVYATGETVLEAWGNAIEQALEIWS